jgi:hypothetical protein
MLFTFAKKAAIDVINMRKRHSLLHISSAEALHTVQFFPSKVFLEVEK